MKPKGALLLILMNIFIWNGLLAQADIRNKIDTLIRALERAEKDSQKVNILKRLGCAHLGTDQEKSWEYWTRGAELAEKIKDKRAGAEIYNNLGYLCEMRNDYDRSLEYYKKSEEMSRELGEKKLNALTNFSIGYVYGKQSNYPLALEYYLYSLKISEEIGDLARVGYILTNIGVIYARQENYDKALEFYNKGLKTHEKVGIKHGVAAACNNIGVVFHKRHNLSEALKYYRKSLEIKKAQGDKYGTAAILGNIGYIYLYQGQHQQALNYYFKSLKLVEDLDGSRQIPAESYKGIGACYLALGKYIAAIEYYTRALTIAREIKKPEIIKETAEGLSKAYAGLNRFKEAYEYHLLFKEQSDSLKNEEKSKKITQLTMQYEFDKKQKDLELEQQKKILEGEMEIKRQRILWYTFAGAFLLMFILAVVMFRSFVVKRKANRMLSRQKRELSELNATKDKIFSIIGHDLKTPFNIMIGFLKLLMTEFDHFDKKRIKEILELAYKSSQNTYSLIENLLVWARAQNGKVLWKPATIELNRQVESNIELVKPLLIKKNLELKNKIEEKLFVFVDQDMLHTILRNLLSNAVKFSRDSGRIDIDAVRQTNDMVEISVSDNGVGIAPEDQDSLFGLGDHVSKRGVSDEPGTGLGLFLCKEFIEKSGGKIEVESEPGKGSTFRFSLPTGNSQKL